MALKKKPKQDEPEEIMDVSETVDMDSDDTLATTETVTESNMDDLQQTVEEQPPQEPEYPEEVSEAVEEKPRSNIFTLMLIIAIVFTITSIVLVCWELNEFYDCTFGGILEVPADGSASAAQPAAAPAEQAPVEPPAEQPPATPPGDASNPDKGN